MRKTSIPGRDLWLKEKQTSTIVPWKEMRKILFFLLCSCHSFDTELNVFFPLFNKSVPVVLWPRGRFFQSHQDSQSWLLLSWEHLSSSPPDLHLSFSSVFFTAYFYAYSFMASSLPHYTFSCKTCFVFYRWTSSACFCPHRYCWESFACGRLVGAGLWRSAAFDAGWLG